MKYSVAALKNHIARGANPEMIGFFGDHTDKSKERVFSNFQHAPFYYDEQLDPKQPEKTRRLYFSCVEQFFMYQKAKLFNDQIRMKALLNPKLHPADYKHLGKQVTPYNDAKWNATRDDAMKQGLYLKFSQNKEFYDVLMNTGDAILIETSPYDTIWGIGLGKTKRPGKPYIDWKNVNNWRGENRLGFALMDIRDVFRATKKATSIK